MDVSDFSSLPPDENSNISTNHNQDKVTTTAKANSKDHETILISSDEESVIEILTTRHDISSIFKTITESSYNAIKSKLNYKPPPTITVKHNTTSNNNSNSNSNKENQYMHNKKQKLSSSSSSSTKQLTFDSFTTTITNNNKKAL